MMIDLRFYYKSNGCQKIISIKFYWWILLIIPVLETVTAAFVCFILCQPGRFGFCYLVGKAHFSGEFSIEDFIWRQPFQCIAWPVVVITNSKRQVFFEMAKICYLFLVKKMPFIKILS